MFLNLLITFLKIGESKSVMFLYFVEKNKNVDEMGYV